VREELHEIGSRRRVEVAEADHDEAELGEDPTFAVLTGCSAAVTVASQRPFSLHAEAIHTRNSCWCGRVASASVAFELNIPELIESLIELVEPTLCVLVAPEQVFDLAFDSRLARAHEPGDPPDEADLRGWTGPSARLTFSDYDTDAEGSPAAPW
jgi:hypothetical protein